MLAFVETRQIINPRIDRSTQRDKFANTIAQIRRFHSSPVPPIRTRHIPAQQTATSGKNRGGEKQRKKAKDRQTGTMKSKKKSKFQKESKVILTKPARDAGKGESKWK